MENVVKVIVYLVEMGVVFDCKGKKLVMIFEVVYFYFWVFYLVDIIGRVIIDIFVIEV